MLRGRDAGRAVSWNGIVYVMCVMGRAMQGAWRFALSCIAGALPVIMPGGSYPPCGICLVRAGGMVGGSFPGSNRGLSYFSVPIVNRQAQAQPGSVTSG